MKRAITGILDMVGQTMEETAKRVGDDTTIKVLARVREWVNQKEQEVAWHGSEQY
ncbi:MAG: hypothetical protein AB9866_23410 [Syntrophobacteraceae bacterium]